MKEAIIKHHKMLLFLLVALVAAGLYLCTAVADHGVIGASSPMPTADSGQESLSNGKLVIQSFTNQGDTLRGVSVYISHTSWSAAEGQDVLLTLSSQGQTIQEWGLSPSDVKSDGYITFMLDEVLTDSQGEAFELSIKSPENDSTLAVAKSSDNSRAGAQQLMLGTEAVSGQQLCFRTVETVVSSGLFTVVALIIIAALLLGFLRFTVLPKRPEVVFLFLFVALGIVYMAATPALKTPDEINHFLRSVDVREGNLISENNPDSLKTGLEKAGGYLPGNLIPQSLRNATQISYQNLASAAGERVDKEQYEFYTFANTTLYSPTVYVPQAIGIFLADLVSDSPLLWMYAGRIVNFICIALLLFFSVKYIPFGKSLIVLISLFPMMLQSVISLSGDGMTYAAVTGLVALILYLRCTYKGHLRKRHYFMLLGLCLFIALSKIVYIPLCLLLFLLPVRLFKDKRTFWLSIGSIAGLAVLANFIWLYLASGFLTEFQPGVNSGQQVVYVLQHLWQYALTVFRTVNVQGYELLYGMFGISLGWLNINTGVLLVTLYLLVVLRTTLLDNDISQKGFTIPIRILFGVTGLCVAALICTSLYVQWTSVGKSVIDGLQGRYIIPVLLLFLLAVKPREGMLHNQGLKLRYSYATALTLSLCAASMVVLAAL